ncbi:alpha-amylase family glycosyl hydrolase [Bacteroides sp. AN502(2024)]|uniref:alpha-amylase family glycosyl hydrolase n=1 Tax=Bacteroides sp. AN502(2024) TaxID=3160599 RepID=UPI003513562F
MKKDIRPIFWMLLCLLTIAACSDENHEMLITGPKIPELDHEPSIEELVEGINNYPTKFKGDKQGKIWYRATAGDDLYGYKGDVYVHIGINDWMHVPTEWGINEDKYKAEKVADNIWCFTLAPTVREWFGAENAANIQNVCILFRNGEALTDEKKTSDFFITVTGDKTFTPTPVEIAACPVEEAGIHPSADGTSVTFALYDLDTDNNYKDYACLIGDFNDWELSTEYQMKRDNDKHFWWYTVTNITPAKEYGFQYYIGSEKDGNVRIGDPYCEKVLDGSNDKHLVQQGVYPASAIQYPNGKTTGIVSVFQTKPTSYNWQVSDFKIDYPDNMVIYELLFRDFTQVGPELATGTIKEAMKHLAYIKSLGVNAIELMPIQEFDGNNSWGYNPCYYFAMDKAYGTKEEYKHFIDECHKQGIAVLLDVVYNHATGSHPFAKLYWNSKESKTAKNNPWFNVDAPHPFSVFHDFNHESPLVREFVKRNLKFLLEEYKFDGFRFDLTKGFTQNKSSESTASNRDDSRIAILKDYYETVNTTNPNAVMILEHFCNLDEESELAEAGMKLWHNMNESYCQSGMGESSRSDFSYMRNNGMPAGRWINFMESHDEERVAYKQAAYGNLQNTSLAIRMKQLETNAAFFLTVPGPKMIWQFGELGYDYSIMYKHDGTMGTEKNTDAKPVKWNYLDNQYRKELYDTYSTLLKLRNENPDLFSDSAFKDWKVSVSDWDKGRYLRLESSTKKLVVVGNFMNEQININVYFGNPGDWYELNGATLKVTNSEQSVTIPANSFKLYTNFQINN